MVAHKSLSSNDMHNSAFMNQIRNVHSIPKISGLEERISAHYDIVQKEQVLDPILDQCDIAVVAGAFFGDEGKGKTVDAIANHSDIRLIARTNSGENAGHTVVQNGKKYVFHLTPSGILTGKTNVIGANCVMDPLSFLNELKPLDEDGIDYSNLKIDNVHIVTPYHKIIDALGKANGSTLKGMSPVHASKVTKKGLRLNTLFNSSDMQKNIIETDLEIYQALLAQKQTSEECLVDRFQEMNGDGNKRIPDHVIDFLKAKNKTDFLIELYRENVQSKSLFTENRGSLELLANNVLTEGFKILFEGPQSYWLSNDVDTHWRAATSANTTASGILAASGVNHMNHRVKVFNVHKTPASSRVGNGANPAGYISQDFFSSRGIKTLADLRGVCDDFDKIQTQYFNSIQDNGILDITQYMDSDGQMYPINVAMAIASSKQYGERGATTLKPRITGLFDCVAHHKVNMAQGPHLTISALDRGDNCDHFGLVIGYVISNESGEQLRANNIEYKHGDIIRPGESMPDEHVLMHCVPIIKKLPGWKGTPISAGQFKSKTLPKNAANAIAEIEHYTGAQVFSIGNGPDTNDVLYLKKTA